MNFSNSLWRMNFLKIITENCRSKTRVFGTHFSKRLDMIQQSQTISRFVLHVDRFKVLLLENRGDIVSTLILPREMHEH